MLVVSLTVEQLAADYVLALDCARAARGVQVEWTVAAVLAGDLEDLGLDGSVIVIPMPVTAAAVELTTRYAAALLATVDGVEVLLAPLAVVHNDLMLPITDTQPPCLPLLALPDVGHRLTITSEHFDALTVRVCAGR